MITGFTGMGQNELIGALSRSKYGRPPAARDVQPMPGKDTVQSNRPQTGEISASGKPASLAVQRPVTVDRPTAPNTPTQPTQPADEMSMFDRMRASFFTSTGDENFDPKADLNSDGIVNHADLAVLRSQDEAPSAKDMLQHMRDSFFARAGDDRFDSMADLNTDGVINFADMAMLRAQMDGAVSRPPPIPIPQPIGPADTDASAGVLRPDPITEIPVLDARPVTPATPDTQVTLDAIRSAFFSQAGDESFNAAADLNGDGRINFADLAEQRARES